MSYVDGFVTPVPTAKREEYRQHAADVAVLFRQAGATAVVECWGDEVPPGKLTSFPLAVQCRDDETVVFSWISWPSREVRDAGWKTVMADPHMADAERTMPFDGRRLIYGGFEVLLQA